MKKIIKKLIILLALITSATIVTAFMLVNKTKKNYDNSNSKNTEKNWITW